MDDLPRLAKDNPSALEVALLEAGVSYRSPVHSRSKTLAALGLASSAVISTATTSGTGGAIAGTSTWFAKIGWVKLLAGASLLGALTPVVYRQLHRQPAVRSTSVQVSTIGPQRTSSPSTPQTPFNVPVEPVASVSREGAATDTLAPKDPSNGRQSLRGEPAVAGLGGELASLDEARSLLAAGNSAGALTKLDAYNRAFPKGRLQLEAEVLRIDAFRRSGQVELARKRADAFLKKNPNSVLASRVRALMGS